MVEPTVTVFIWKSIPANSEVLCLKHTEEPADHVLSRASTKEKLTDGGVHSSVQASCAVVLDKGGLTHSCVTQEYHLKQSLRTDNFALKFK